MEEGVVIVAVGPDKPGLISTVSSIVSDLAGNVEDMDQVVLRGIFIMSLVIRFIKPIYDADIGELTKHLTREGEKVGLQVHVHPINSFGGK
jgi:predicted amino acid-binding ACT domain protein